LRATGGIAQFFMDRLRSNRGWSVDRYGLQMGSIGVNRVILGQRREKARCACGSALACGSKLRAFSAGCFRAD